MKRDLSRLSRKTFDLCVIGGGIYGACVARDATLRGLSVALVEKSDFASATSANSLKIIHGGLRYLQQVDLRRMRESIRERRSLMRIAPHLVHPLPVVIPQYRGSHWTKRREVLFLALAANDLISFDRNRLADPGKHLPRGRLISRGEVEELVPGVDGPGLAGGMLFYDAQVYNSERLVLSFLRSAAEAGAEVANYVEATGFLRKADTIVGITARDILTGDDFEIQARTVVNTGGPWINGLMDLLPGRASMGRVSFAKAINLVTRPLFQNYAVGVSSKGSPMNNAPGANKSNRLFFIVPWRGRSLVGTYYSPYEGDPDDFQVTGPDVHRFLDDVNQAVPAVALQVEDVSLVLGGMVPSSEAEGWNVQRSRHYKIIDHRQDGLRGIISVSGVKYTTARDIAEKVVDLVFDTWGRKVPESTSAAVPLYGGDIPRFESFLRTELNSNPFGLGGDTVRRLVLNYGTAYSQVLVHAGNGVNGQPAPAYDLDVVRAEVRHGVREEMALRLSDVVFRRTELGSAGHPGGTILKVCADTMAAELGWDETRTRTEIREVEGRYPFYKVPV